VILVSLKDLERTVCGFAINDDIFYIRVVLGNDRPDRFLHGTDVIKNYGNDRDLH
jgi:hypothetical protein